MKLIHYTPVPLELGEPQPVHRIGKPPKGFWVSVESGRKDGWRDWCEGENFSLERLTLAYEIVLKRKANVLRINSAQGILDFEQEYARPTGWRNRRGYYDLEEGKAAEAYVSHYDGIDWERVMQKHGAIIIAPYQWKCRMDVMWYYCWDCASGVIWDISIISEVKPAPEFARPKEEEPANG